jgi:hypothetical protein
MTEAGRETTHDGRYFSKPLMTVDVEKDFCKSPNAR